MWQQDHLLADCLLHMPTSKVMQVLPSPNMCPPQVLAQRQLLERLFQHDMGLPEERLRRCAALHCWNSIDLQYMIDRPGHFDSSLHAQQCS